MHPPPLRPQNQPPPPYGAPPPPYHAPQQTGPPAWAWILIGLGGCAVIGVPILAAILFPVFAQAREKARQAGCAVNMRQVSVAVMMYVQDYDMVYPLAENWADGLMSYGSIHKDIERKTVFTCPKIGNENNPVFSYGYNSNLNQFKLAQVTDPAQVFLLFESDKKTRNASDPLESRAYPPRHSDGNNFAYTNGSVKWIRLDNLASAGSVYPTGGVSMPSDVSSFGNGQQP